MRDTGPIQLGAKAESNVRAVRTAKLDRNGLLRPQHGPRDRWA